MKEIKIQSTEDLYKKLFLYKSILYKNTNFVIENDDEQTNMLVKALNIKNRRKRIEFVYDYCCNTVDRFNEGKNICGFKNGQCYMQQLRECKLKDGCCRLCIHQNGKGCETSNISCKFFYCEAVTEKNKVLKYSDFPILKIFSFRQRLMVKCNFFTTREEIINDMYFESIFIYGFRLCFRIIRDYIIFNIKRLKKRLNKKSVS